MSTFLGQLKDRQGDLDGDIFEMLYTLSGMQERDLWNVEINKTKNNKYFL